MSAGLLILVVLAYVLVLFSIGRYGERMAVHRRVASQPLIWSMALAVYCTSWTYYGAVGRSASSAWSYLPIYLGPALVFLFGYPALRRMIELAKQQRLTSAADFVAARHGRAPRIAVLITLISVLAVLPYIALQLKAINETFLVLVDPQTALGWDIALLTAIGLGSFAILFGTRHISASESHRGLTLAIAFESVFKLLVLGLICLVASMHAPELTLRPALERLRAEPIDVPTFWVQTVLAALAIFCLPRQFHITVVENTDPRDLDRARWYFPLYLLLVSVLVAPLSQLGLTVLPPEVNADTYVLRLPMWLGSDGLAVFAYLGGFSAATAMIVVSSIALSIMISNEVVMPGLLRSGRLSERDDLGRVLKLTRRLSIVLVLTLAYVVYRFLAQSSSLASIGLIAFVGISQLAPSLLGAMYWSRANRAGAFWGLVVGGALWVYTLLLPAMTTGTAWIEHGPFGIAWLAPQALFGLVGLDPVVHAAVISLSANVLVYIVLSLFTETPLQERLDAARFINATGHQRTRSASVADLILLLERFYGSERAKALIADYQRHTDTVLDTHAAHAPDALADYVERLLAGAMGGATASALMDAMLGARTAPVSELAQVLDQTSRLLQFNRELLQSALDNLSQAVSVVDANQRLVAWNRGYQQLFALPESLLKIGEPIESILRFNAQRGLLGEGDADAQVERRLEHLRQQSAHRSERILPDGRVLDVQGQPMPGGGFVTSFADITNLKRANLVLERRVAQRTRELQQAQAEAERANLSKTRFLAAASHDLMQPLNAARLFATAAATRGDGSDVTELVTGIEQSLESMEALLGSLLDISKLDAGVLDTRIEALPLSDVFNALATEFSLQMQRKGIQLRIQPTRLWVRSDAALLKRVLQNFLSNAMRYTRTGRVVLGVRRLGGENVRIEVLDTGPGIAAKDHERIFAEFQRLGSAENHGFGLGLAICKRIARLLDHDLSLRSVQGRGSAFCMSVPRAPVGVIKPQAGAGKPASRRNFAGLRVLVVENDPGVLKATQALLSQWGCDVLTAADEVQAQTQAVRAQLLIMDFHLDDELLGSDVIRRINADRVAPLPAILVTADHSGEADWAAAQLGCPVLKKPLKPAALRALISRLRLV